MVHVTPYFQQIFEISDDMALDGHLHTLWLSLLQAIIPFVIQVSPRMSLRIFLSLLMVAFILSDELLCTISLS